MIKNALQLEKKHIQGGFVFILLILAIFTIKRTYRMIFMKKMKNINVNIETLNNKNTEK